MDNIDLRILAILQADGRITMKELGLRVGLTSPATIERVKKLEESGVIGGYKAIIDINRAGLPIRAFVILSAANDQREAVNRLAQEHDNIIHCHRVAGEATHLLEVAVADMHSLELLLDELAQLGKATPLVILSSPVENKTLVLPKVNHTT